MFPSSAACILELATRKDNVTRWGYFELERFAAWRQCTLHFCISWSNKVQTKGLEINDCLVVAQCCEAEETRQIGVMDSWCT